MVSSLFSKGKEVWPCLIFTLSRGVVVSASVKLILAKSSVRFGYFSSEFTVASVVVIICCYFEDDR